MSIRSNDHRRPPTTTFILRPVIHYELTGRDADIVHAVARFQQLASSHIHELLFSNLSSPTPYKRAVLRLVKHHYLHRIEHRMVGGHNSGSGQYAYELGPEGWAIYKPGQYKHRTTPDYHALMVADIYLCLVRLERSGVLRIKRCLVEDEAYKQYGRYELHPDLFVDLTLASGHTVKIYIEAERTRKSKDKITEKLERYYNAWGESDEDEFPVIFWIPFNEQLRYQITAVIQRQPEDVQVLFRVRTLAQLPKLFTRLVIHNLLGNLAIYA